MEAIVVVLLWLGFYGREAYLDRNGGLLSPSGPREKNGILSNLPGGHLMTGTEQQKEPDSNS
jgi:hypothetical protein